jgi:hypothetical protein
VWFVSISASPVAGTEDFAKVGGAHVNCWLALPEHEALARAAQLVEAYGWRVEVVDESREVARADYESDSSGLSYFEQALRDREVVVFHTWPNEAKDRGTLQ